MGSSVPRGLFTQLRSDAFPNAAGMLMMTGLPRGMFSQSLVATGQRNTAGFIWSTKPISLGDKEPSLGAPTLPPVCSSVNTYMFGLTV